MNDINKMYVVEWSITDKNTNIQSISEMLTGNLNAILNGGNTSYIPIAIVSSGMEASKFAGEFEARLAKSKIIS